MKSERPIVVAVSGFSSNVGKTTLVCELLKSLPGWEAIKVSRGHYRSCGKDPVACCVSDLIGEEPLVRSGREANYEAGKDTGKFWDSGATNVHWVIVNDEQVQRGIVEALDRVEAPGVIIEGNSFLQYVETDLAIMCARSEGGKIKASAREALRKTSVLYLTSLNGDATSVRNQFSRWRSTLPIPLEVDHLRLYSAENLPDLIRKIRLIAEYPRSSPTPLSISQR